MPEDLMAGLANEPAGVNLTTVGHLLQAIDKRVADGVSIDMAPVKKALEAVVKRLNDPELPDTARGTYNGTRPTEKLVKAMNALKEESKKLIFQMGGVDGVLQDLAAAHVHDRLLNNIHKHYPQAFDGAGEWLGLDDGRRDPTDFLHSGAIDTLQRMSDCQSSLKTFEQLQGKAQELLKIPDMVVEPDIEPEDPPASPRTPLGSPGSGKPEAGANWNWNNVKGGSGGSVTISPGAFQSSAASEAVLIEAFRTINDMSERYAKTVSEALQTISNLRAAAGSAQTDIHGQRRAPLTLEASVQTNDDAESAIGAIDRVLRGYPDNESVADGSWMPDDFGAGDNRTTHRLVDENVFASEVPVHAPASDVVSDGASVLKFDDPNAALRQDGGYVSQEDLPGDVDTLSPVTIDEPDYDDEEYINKAIDLGKFRIPRPVAIPTPDYGPVGDDDSPPAVATQAGNFHTYTRHGGFPDSRIPGDILDKADSHSGSIVFTTTSATSSNRVQSADIRADGSRSQDVGTPRLWAASSSDSEDSDSPDDLVDALKSLGGSSIRSRRRIPTPAFGELQRLDGSMVGTGNKDGVSTWQSVTIPESDHDDPESLDGDMDGPGDRGERGNRSPWKNDARDIESAATSTARGNQSMQPDESDSAFFRRVMGPGFLDRLNSPSDSYSYNPMDGRWASNNLGSQTQVVATRGRGHDIFSRVPEMAGIAGDYLSSSRYEKDEHGKWKPTATTAIPLIATNGVGTSPMDKLTSQNIHPQFSGSFVRPSVIGASKSIEKLEKPLDGPKLERSEKPRISTELNRKTRSTGMAIENYMTGGFFSDRTDEKLNTV